MRQQRRPRQYINVYNKMQVMPAHVYVDLHGLQSRLRYYGGIICIGRRLSSVEFQPCVTYVVDCACRHGGVKKSLKCGVLEP